MDAPPSVSRSGGSEFMRTKSWVFVPWHPFSKGQGMVGSTSEIEKISEKKFMSWSNSWIDDLHVDDDEPAGLLGRQLVDAELSGADGEATSRINSRALACGASIIAPLCTPGADAIGLKKSPYMHVEWWQTLPKDVKTNADLLDKESEDVGEDGVGAAVWF